MRDIFAGKRFNSNRMEEMDGEGSCYPSRRCLGKKKKKLRMFKHVCWVNFLNSPERKWYGLVINGLANKVAKQENVTAVDYYHRINTTSKT